MNMDYEKAYKEALEKIRDGLHPLPDGTKISGVTKAFLEEVFPELAESKDEKVRKALITFFQRFPYDSIEQAGTNAKEAIAWLEKQGQEPKKVSIWKHWKNGIAGNGDGKPIYLIKNGFTYSLSSCLSFECDYIELSELDNLLLEKQGEQKNKINSYKITFEDVLVLECAMKTIKITEGGNELYEKLAPLYNKIHNVYLLEKQGEQKSIMNVPSREVILSIWDLGNEWKKLTNGSISTEYGTQLDYIQKHWHESEYYLRAKQDEKKVPINAFKAKNWYVSEVDGKIHDMTYNPTNKVEPKFKVGDWIANDYCTGKVIALTDDAYLLDSGQGIPFSCEHNAHLWTIRDAKDGDVLIDKSHVGECVFIFKEARPSDIKTDVNNPLAIIGYCGINHIGFTSQLSGLGFGDTVNCTYYPATKEQRELLFQKMKEAGYQWDAEKKELKLLISNGGDFESNNSKQKPTWSDEDERMCQETIDWFEKKCFPYALEHENPARESIKWLKSLKERLS